MKDIVIMFVHTRDLNLLEEQPSDVAEVQRADKLVTNDGSLPPFWTWFIENPRPGSSRSSPTIAALNSRNIESA